MAIGRILIADDHPLVQEGIQLAIGARHPGNSVDVAGSIAEAEALNAKGTEFAIKNEILYIPLAD